MSHVGNWYRLSPAFYAAAVLALRHASPHKSKAPRSTKGGRFKGMNRCEIAKWIRAFGTTRNSDASCLMKIAKRPITLPGQAGRLEN